MDESIKNKSNTSLNKKEIIQSEYFFNREKYTEYYKQHSRFSRKLELDKSINTNLKLYREDEKAIEFLADYLSKKLNINIKKSTLTHFLIEELVTNFFEGLGDFEKALIGKSIDSLLVNMNFKWCASSRTAVHSMEEYEYISATRNWEENPLTEYEKDFVSKMKEFKTKNSRSE